MCHYFPYDTIVSAITCGTRVKWLSPVIKVRCFDIIRYITDCHLSHGRITFNKIFTIWHLES